MKCAAAAILLPVIVLCGCGSGDGKGALPGTKPGTVASPKQYKDAAVPLAKKVLAVSDQLPNPSDVSSKAGFERQVTAQADGIRTIGDQLQSISPPAVVLTDHHDLFEGVSTVEFDLRDVGSSTDSAAARAAVTRLKSDLLTLDTIIKRIESKLGS